VVVVVVVGVKLYAPAAGEQEMKRQTRAITHTIRETEIFKTTEEDALEEQARRPRNTQG